MAQTSTQWRDILSDARMTQSIITKLHSTFRKTELDIAKKLNTPGARKVMIKKGCIPYLEIIVECITNTTDHNLAITLGNDSNVTIPARKSADELAKVCVNKTIYKQLGTCAPIDIPIVISPTKVTFSLSRYKKRAQEELFQAKMSGGSTLITMQEFKPEADTVNQYRVNLIVSEEMLKRFGLWTVDKPLIIIEPKNISLEKVRKQKEKTPLEVITE